MWSCFIGSQEGGRSGVKFQRPRGSIQVLLLFVIGNKIEQQNGHTDNEIHKMLNFNVHSVQVLLFAWHEQHHILTTEITQRPVRGSRLGSKRRRRDVGVKAASRRLPNAMPTFREKTLSKTGSTVLEREREMDGSSRFFTPHRLLFFQRFARRNPAHSRV